MADNDAPSSQGKVSPQSPIGKGTSHADLTPAPPSNIPLDPPVSAAQTPGAEHPPPQESQSPRQHLTCVPQEMQVYLRKHECTSGNMSVPQETRVYLRKCECISGNASVPSRNVSVPQATRVYLRKSECFSRNAEDLTRRWPPTSGDL